MTPEQEDLQDFVDPMETALLELKESFRRMINSKMPAKYVADFDKRWEDLKNPPPTLEDAFSCKTS